MNIHLCCQSLILSCYFGTFGTPYREFSKVQFPVTSSRTSDSFVIPHTFPFSSVPSLQTFTFPSSSTLQLLNFTIIRALSSLYLKTSKAPFVFRPRYTIHIFLNISNSSTPSTTGSATVFAKWKTAHHLYVLLKSLFKVKPITRSDWLGHTAAPHSSCSPHISISPTSNFNIQDS